MFSFFLWSWLTAAILAAPAGVLGCFIFWRRMAFFADSLAHASLLGLALGFVFEINLFVGIFACSVVLCVFLWLASSKKELATDALLNLAAHFFLGAGILCVSLAGLRIDLLSYFLGEWLAAGPKDALLLSVVGVITLCSLWWLRRPLLSLSAQEEIAKAERGASRRTELLFLLIMALFISAAVQTVGLLLINTLMIMPAVIVRARARSPYQMIFYCVLVALFILSAGLYLSLVFDLPASPAAAVTGGFVFLFSRLSAGLMRRRTTHKGQA